MNRLSRFRIRNWPFRRSQLIILSGLTALGMMLLAAKPAAVSAIETVSQQATAPLSWNHASFPVENFQDYTSPFGYRNSPYGGGTRFHYGLDLAAPRGSYIRNWWAGYVAEVSDDSACGTMVAVQSGEWTHIYCHMEGWVETVDGKRAIVDREGGLVISEGQRVPTGARIGRVGMSGRTTGPHLHWGMKYSSQWVDPGMVLKAMYDQQHYSQAAPNQ